jgi:hypothetical protein
VLLRACRKTAWPCSERSLAADWPMPSEEPVMKMRAMVCVVVVAALLFSFFPWKLVVVVKEKIQNCFIIDILSPEIFDVICLHNPVRLHIFFVI